MDTLETIIDEMVQHARSHPTHGYNCACKDDMLRRARRLIKDRGEDFYKEFLYLAAVLERGGPLLW